MDRRFSMSRGWRRLVATGLTLGAGVVPLAFSQLAQASAAPATAPSVEACGTGAAVVQPGSMVLACADSGEVARKLTWTSWTAAQATATGEVAWRPGTNFTHATKWDKAAASFTLSDPVTEPGNKVLFTQLTMHVTGTTPSGFKRDLTFDESPQPAITRAPVKTPAAAPDAAAPAASSGTLNTAAIGGYWELAGGPSSVAKTAEAITGAEASFEPGIIQPGNPYSTTGWGLWQITPGNSETAYGEDYQLLDPWNNAEAAVAKYDGAGGFSPWTTYDDGAYESYVKYEQTPNTSLSDPGQYTPINSAPSGTHNSSKPGSTYGPVMPGAGTVDIFWKDASDNLEQASGPADGSLVGPVERAAMGSDSSNPAVAVQANGYTYVYWEENGDLWEDYWNGSWSGAFDQGIGNVASQPTVAVNSAGSAFVFWKGANGDLWEAGGPAAGTLNVGPFDRGMGTLGSAPTVGIDSHSYTYVYWQGTDGHLYESYWNPSTSAFTSATEQSGMGTLGSAPSAVVTGDGVAHVFWKGTDGNLWEGSGNANGTLTGPTNRAMGTLGSAPSAGMSAANWPAVYWTGTDGTLWEGYYNGSGWSGPVSRTSVGTLANPPSVAIYGG